MTHDDAKLLREFASEGSESAFAEIVRRNLDFVYSTALRQVHHDSLLAADVSQSVFVDLARKACSLRADIPLAAWLHRATSLAAAVATPLVIHHNANSRLQSEIQALKLQSAELDRLRRENAELAGLRVDADEMARLRSQQRELFRLRGQVALLRRENERLAAEKIQRSNETAKIAPEPPVDFISADAWTEVGADTPEQAFQSFLAVLKAGDPQQIASTVHWDVQWREDITEEDQQLVEKSMQDYVDMLQRAPERMSAFRLSSVTDASSDRKRVSFSTLTSDGAQIDSNFEMIFAQNEWKPVLRMGWHTYENQTVFATSPVFGPEIDL